MLLHQVLQNIMFVTLSVNSGSNKIGKKNRKTDDRELSKVGFRKTGTISFACETEPTESNGAG